MSEALINDLPAEIIIEILRKVDQRSLKNAALTCKLWKELIESSCTWSLTLDHQSNATDEPWVGFLLTTNRKFSKMKLEYLGDLEKNRIVDIFHKHGQHISKLFMYESRLDKFDLFVNVLKRMPNLEHLILHRIRTQCTVADVPADDKLPELMKLKTLEIVESDGSIIECFKRSKLTEVKLLCEDRSVTQETVLTLLRTQSNVKILALQNIDYGTSELFQTNLMDGSVKFQLSLLSLLDIQLRESPNDYNNLLKFLKPQAKTSKFLELVENFRTWCTNSSLQNSKI